MFTNVKDLYQKYAKWSSCHHFDMQRRRILSGMAKDEIRNILGEPDAISRYENELDSDEIWEYTDALRNHTSFCLAFLDGRYSHSWTHWAVNDE